MGVDPDILNDFNAQSSVFNIQEMKDNSRAIEINEHPVYNFNPIEKIIGQASKIEELYKDLLQSERDKVELLKQTIDTLKKDKK